MYIMSDSKTSILYLYIGLYYALMNANANVGHKSTFIHCIPNVTKSTTSPLLAKAVNSEFPIDIYNLHAVHEWILLVPKSTECYRDVNLILYQSGY